MIPPSWERKFAGKLYNSLLIGYFSITHNNIFHSCNHRKIDLLSYLSSEPTRFLSYTNIVFTLYFQVGSDSKDVKHLQTSPANPEQTHKMQPGLPFGYTVTPNSSTWASALSAEFNQPYFAAVRK